MRSNEGLTDRALRCLASAGERVWHTMTGIPTYDVLIAGSGPAGSSAALRLATAGISVAVLEKESLPRYKTCGGGLVRRARRLLPIDLSDLIERECHAVEVSVLESGVGHVFERAEPVISMTMRDALDYRLVCEAERAGADVRTRCKVLGVEQRPDGVEVTTDAGPLGARFLIAADGALSAVARAAGWSDDRLLIPALESEVHVSDAVFDRFRGSARFDLDVVGHGYAWLFPKRDHLSAGVLSVRRGPIDLRTQLEGYYRRIGIDSIVREERHGFVIPVRPRRDGFARGRVLLVGDAAGFADPVTAEGITWAIRSGQIAGDVLAGLGPAWADAAGEYERQVEREILPELRIGARFARLIYGYPGIRDRLFRHWGRRLGENLTQVFCGEGTYRQLYRKPFEYLRVFGS